MNALTPATTPAAPRPQGRPQPLEFALNHLEQQDCYLVGGDNRVLDPKQFVAAVRQYEAQPKEGQAPKIYLYGPPSDKKVGWQITSEGRLKEFAYAQAGLNRELDQHIASEPDERTRRIRQNMLDTLRTLQACGVKFYRSAQAKVALGAKIAPLWQVEEGRTNEEARLYATLKDAPIDQKIRVETFAALHYEIQCQQPQQQPSA